MKCSALFVAVSTLLVPAAAGGSVNATKEGQTFLRHMQEAGMQQVQLNDGMQLELADSGHQQIIGGFTQTTVLPWFVAFFACSSSGTSCGQCGATLVHEDIVMTAAHCVDTHNLVPTVAVIGALNVVISGGSVVHDGTQIFPVSGTLSIHPNWDTTNIANGYDIAMFKISPSSSNSVVSLNTDTTVPSNGQALYIFGHGDTVNGGSGSSSLQGLQTDAVVSCPTSASNAIDQHVCLFASASSGACSGDSGGPVVTSAVTSDPTAATQLGIASYVIGPVGSECAADNPDVYLDVSFFSTFISDYICNNSANPPSSCSSTPAPTASPTTAAPTSCPCFSESATVQVQDDDSTPRLVPMKDLQVGQKVFAGYQESGLFGKKAKTPIYETIYGFGHRNADRNDEFLRITTKGSENQPLEISGSHLIFVPGKEDPVRADSLQVGDQLLHKSVHIGDTQRVTITKIERIVQKGLYQPLTKDGTIVVNGMEASTYVSVEELSPRMVQLGRKVFSEHNGFHWWTAPYRFVCTKVAPQLCVDDYNFEEDGISHWMAFGKSLILMGEDLPTWAMAILIAIVMSFCGAVMILDNLLEGDVKVWSALASGFGLYWLWSSKKNLPGKAKIE